MQSVKGGVMKTDRKETPKEFYQKYGVKACLTDRIIYYMQIPTIKFIIIVASSVLAATIMHLILRR
jgi:hypothetical protein